MYKLFGILILSALFTGILTVPFINLLYKLKFQNPKYKSKDILGRKTLFAKLHGWKVGTPTGGGILIIISTFLFSAIFYAVTKFSINWTAIILFFTLFSFGLLGLYDDIQKFFNLKRTGLWSLHFRYKFLIQWVLALLIGYLLYTKMNLHSIYIPIFNFQFSIFNFYPIFAASVIVATSNAFNITDGLDGLSTGLLLIALSAFWYLAGFSIHHGDIRLFIAVLIGALLPFLYFNIYPARLYLGDTGALAFGAMLGVITLMIDQTLVLPVIGGVFVAEAASSIIQVASFTFRKGKRVFLIAPLHHHFEAKGWDETKVTMRFWLAGVALAFIGLFIATFGRT
ncbi:MAG: phospho-N-acetylmuramoyl-pentapeptide-transferase [Candidatus Cloacimonetes bacterium]|nr:phospho-N-acetylmuramoyl-pentapeptide-transferase [Candidatus Cloacimonadota bacterium]